MLICVKEKKGAAPQYAEGNSKRKLTRCTLKGSILIKKHLKHVESNPGSYDVFWGSHAGLMLFNAQMSPSLL